VRYNIQEQGNLQGTTSSTDLAIQGKGFFLVADSSGAKFLTRAGSFIQDNSGNLVNAAGFKLLGYPLGSGRTAADGVQAIKPVNVKVYAAEQY
jgi:flagellar hook protein FlgE